MFRSINSKFYLVVAMLLTSYGVSSLFLTYFVRQQTTSYTNLNNAIVLKRTVADLNDSFHKARLREKEILNQSNFEAEKQFGNLLQHFRMLMGELQQNIVHENIKAKSQQLITEINNYEDLISNIVQLKTKKILLDTRLNSTFQSLSSTLLNENNPTLLRSLFSINHFFLTYQTQRKNSQYKALEIAAESLQKKIAANKHIDVRLTEYVNHFGNLLDLNHQTNHAISVMNQEIEQTSSKLSKHITQVTNTIEISLQDTLRISNQNRNNLQVVLLSLMILGTLLLLVILQVLKSSIIRPVRSIAHIISKVQRGDIGARFDHNKIKSDEIIEMGVSLNKMLESIETRDKALVEYQETLQKQLNELSLQELEQERLTKRIQRIEKMEAIGTLAAGVAHDLNNILSGVVSYPELLLLDMPKDSPYRKPMELIQESGNRAAAIVQDLLTLARRGAAVLETTNLNKLVKSYLSSPEARKMLAEHPSVSLKMNLEKDLFNTKGSSVHLLKTLMNLIINGVESIQGNGTLTITTENRYISQPFFGYERVEKGDYTVLIISDTGQGIEGKYLERIFEPFFTRKKMGKSSGSGLGLSVVWGTVQDHHGYIDVQSKVNEGTTFTLYFPATREESEEQGIKRSLESIMGNGESILIVDDMENQRKIGSKMLQKLGYNTLTATSGEEAIKLLAKHPVDILLLDMLMPPGMDGLETYKQALTFYPDQKAIIASGYSETDRVIETQRLGPAIYIKKPYTLETLGVAINQQLHRKNCPSQSSPLVEKKSRR